MSVHLILYVRTFQSLPSTTGDTPKTFTICPTPQGTCSTCQTSPLPAFPSLEVLTHATGGT
jgi:hypothetical protein